MARTAPVARSRPAPALLPAPRRWLDRFGDGLLIVATLAAMWPLLTAEFSLLDDPYTLVNNRWLNPPTWRTIGHYWSSMPYGLYVPVTYTVWAGLAVLARLDQPDPDGIALNPWVFHTANVLLHLVTVLVVRRILRKLVDHPQAAVMGALLYAIHPLQVEPVAWASGTKDVLAGMLGLTAVWLYLNWTCADARRRGWTRYATATLCLALAMLSKPSAMTIPAVAAVLDWLALRRPIPSVVRSVAPWLLLSIGCMIVARVAQPGTGVPEPPLWARPLVVGDSLAFYLSKLVLPIDLTVDYGRTPFSLFGRWWLYVAWLVPASIAALLWFYRKRAPTLLAAGLVFVLAPAPVLGLVTFLYQYFSTVADHYLYVAMLGPALAAAWALTRSPRWVWFAAGGVLVALGVRSHLQARLWHDDLTLFGHAVRVSPRSVLSLNNLASATEHAGDPERAAELYRRAIDVRPEYYQTYDHLAATLTRLGRTDEAVDVTREGLRLKRAMPEQIRPPSLANDLHAFGLILMARGEFEEAVRCFEQALALRPDHPQAADDLRAARAKRPASTAPAQGG